jgi:hypothetical protein
MRSARLGTGGPALEIRELKLHMHVYIAMMGLWETQDLGTLIDRVNA